MINDKKSLTSSTVMMSHQERIRFRRVGCGIPLFIADDFVSADEVGRLIEVAEAQVSRGRDIHHDETGTSCEVPVEGNDPVLTALRDRIARAFGFANAVPDTMRYRRYAPGEWHPPHVDEYRAGACDLVATAMLWLDDTDAGGETLFPIVPPMPVLLRPRRGRLAIWLNYFPDGAVNHAALHEALPVTRGHKITLTNFIYAPAGAVPAFLAGLEPETDIPDVYFRPPVALDDPAVEGGRFVCVNDNVPPITTALLREACERKGVTYVEVDTAAFTFHDTPPLGVGDMLYRPATSMAAMRVEQHLWAPGVATFDTAPDGMFFTCVNHHVLLERAGIPLPRTLPITSTDRSLLRALVEAVGGFPVVLKVLGWSRGVGTMRVGGHAELFSVVDYMLAQGSSPLICRYVADATHWRVTVIGGNAVACYRNILDEDDFRTHGSENPADFPDRVPEPLAAVAVAAVRALKLEFGGVDVLESPDGALCVLESNYPCYFGQSQLVAGVDVAGAMVEHLLAKSRVLTTAALS